MTDILAELVAEKAAARAAAAELRDRLHRDRPGAARRAAGHALNLIGAFREARTASAYLQMRSEIDPTPLMLALDGLGYLVAAPVVEGPGLPLAFRRWRPGAATMPGTLGTRSPSDGEAIVPAVIVTPLLAFDAEGYRLGYGGGYYDRTIAALRAAGPVLAIGLAYAGQQVERVPRGGHDARLDVIATEEGLVRPG